MGDETSFPAKSRVLTVAGIATAVFLVVAGLLGWFAHTGSCSPPGTYSCMTATDWGNFVAGVFAPIAFIWLVVAVRIQSQELAEQRKELQLTREEMSASTEAMKAQAEEAKKQAQFIGLQTEILQRQENDRLRIQAEKEFDAGVQVLADLVDTSLSDVPIHVVIDTGGERRITHLARKQRSRDERILAFDNFLQQTKINFQPPIGYTIDDNSIRSMQVACETALNLVKLGEELGRTQFLTVERLRLPQIASQLTDVLAVDAKTRSANNKDAIVKALLERKPDV